MLHPSAEDLPEPPPGVVEVALESRERREEQVRRLVSLSTDLAGAQEAPTAAEFLRALGEGGETR